MAFYSHRKCVVGLEMDLALTADDGKGTTSGWVNAE